jgi:hypothetical protein
MLIQEEHPLLFIRPSTSFRMTMRHNGFGFFFVIHGFSSGLRFDDLLVFLLIAAKQFEPWFPAISTGRRLRNPEDRPDVCLPDSRRST